MSFIRRCWLLCPNARSRNVKLMPQAGRSLTCSSRGWPPWFLLGYSTLSLRYMHVQVLFHTAPLPQAELLPSPSGSVTAPASFKMQDSANGPKCGSPQNPPVASLTSWSCLFLTHLHAPRLWIQGCNGRQRWAQTEKGTLGSGAAFRWNPEPNWPPRSSGTPFPTLTTLASSHDGEFQQTTRQITCHLSLKRALNDLYNSYAKEATLPHMHLVNWMSKQWLRRTSKGTKWGKAGMGFLNINKTFKKAETVQLAKDWCFYMHRE